MYIYMILCDLQNGSSAETEISSLLNTYNGIRFHPSGWLIKTDEMASVICDRIDELCEKDDYTIVTRLDDTFCCRQPENVKRWIRANM